LVSAAVVPILVFACGGSKAPPPSAPPAASASAAAPVDAGPAAPEPVAHPFAKDAAQATSLIDDAIETRRSAVIDCVQAARTRRNDPRAKVEFDIGVDQEGTLMGVKTPRGGKDDPQLNTCIRDALKGAPFPKSNAGVITVRKGFSDQLVYPK
jgi:hypothetical protein